MNFYVLSSRSSVSGFNCHGTDLRDASDPEVFVTVNAAGSVSLLGKDSNQVRNVVLNWITPTLGKDQRDWVGLFDKDVSHEKSLQAEQALVRVVLNKTISNHYKTGIPLEYQTYPGAEVCLRFWIVYVRGTEVLKSNCLRTNPSWMYDLREDIGQLPLTHVRYI